MSGMNDKNIKKHLSKKLNNWIDSINDTNLQKDVRNCVIVTGGALASLYLGEKVNDYDIYLADINVLKRLTEYYANTVPNFYNGNNSVGFNHDLSGVTLYIQSTGAIDTKMLNLDPDYYESPYHVLYMSSNAITLSGDIQLVLRFSGDYHKIHENFDFEHAKIVYSLHDNNLIASKLALKCLLSKQLIYTGSLYPICSLFRLRKFLKRDWYIDAGQILKICFDVNNLNLSDKDVLIDQLTGVDTTYMLALIYALRGSEPEKLTQSYVFDVIDRIFG